MKNFRVDLHTFSGPLDLLVYLVRKHEVDVLDLPIADIAEQYLAYLESQAMLDVNMAGDFLELSSTLAEIKSRMVLPHAGEEEESAELPRQDLVERLLEYKKFRDAASMLEERFRAWQERFPRLAAEAELEAMPPAVQPIRELELWDLVSAHDRMLRDRQPARAESIVYDDTPIHVFMARISGELTTRGRIAFSELLQPRMHKSTLVGIFLAILELVRHHQVFAFQDEHFGEIWVGKDEGKDEG